MNILDEWLDLITELSTEPPTFWSSNRKIFRHKVWKVKSLDGITLADGGYTNNKMTALMKYYYHEESVEIAKQLWSKRQSQNGYGSVSVSCYNHLVKGGGVEAKRSIRASVFGPCLTTFTITKRTDGSTDVDVIWRTTELVKKLSADLVFLRERLILPNFELPNLNGFNFHFLNATLHPMYVPIILCQFDDPVEYFKYIQKRDKKFFDYMLTTTGRYLIPELHRGIEKHSQSLKVSEQVNKDLTEEKKKDLVKFISKHHHRLKEV